MNAPVTTPPARTTATGGTASRTSGPSRGGDSSAFASMLDDALTTGRSSGRGPSDRGIERRSTPDDRAARAADRAADRADKVADKSDKTAAKAAVRTGHRAERAAAHAAHRATRSITSADGDGDADSAPTPVDATTVASRVPAAETTSTPTTTDVLPTDPSGAGVPAAVWALLMGAPIASTDTPDGAASADAATVVTAAPAPAVGVDLATAAVLPGVASSATTAPARAAEAGQPQQPVVTAAVPAAPAAPASAPAPTAAEAALAQFTVVRADDALPATPPATQPGTTTRPAAVVPTAVAPPSTDQPIDVLTTPSNATTATVPPADAVTVPVTPAAARTSDTPAPVAGAGSVPATAVGSAGQAQSTGADTSSQQGPADGGAAPAASPVVPAGTPVAATSFLAPVSESDSATGASAPQPVGSQVARQVAVLRDGPDGAHTMTLVLTPDSVGPVEVQVTLQKGAVDLTLRGAHEHGRAALLDALPDLRRDLEAAGLTPSRLEVDRDSGGAWLDRHSAQQQAQQQAMAQQQGFGDRGGRQDRAEGRSRPWGTPADTEISGPASPMNRSTSSGVDYRV